MSHPPTSEQSFLWQAEGAQQGELRALPLGTRPPHAGESLWLSDHQGDQVHGFRVRQVLHQGRTAFAHVDVVDTFAYGKLLSLDGQVQSAAQDEAAYHETLVVPAFIVAPRPLRRVAILGGGEGATLREVLRFPEVEQCVMVDIDAELVALCRSHLPEWSAGAFQDPRAVLRCGDARAFLEECAQADEVFDLIICDLPEAEVASPLQRLYSHQFFAVLRRCLSQHGIYAGQIGSLQSPATVLGPPRILTTLISALELAYPLMRFIPSYWGEWLYALAGPGLGAVAPLKLTADEVDERLGRRRSLPCVTYDGLTHQRLFALPKDLRQRLAHPAALIDDVGC